METPLYVITACHNRRDITLSFLDTLRAQALSSLRLILVDDGSTDGTAEAVLARMPDAVILRGNGDLWWGGSLQMAYKYVRDHLQDELDSAVMICNDDILLPKGYCTKALTLLKANPRTLISGCGYDLNGALRDGAYKRDFTHKKPDDGPYEPAWEDGDVCSSRSLFFTVKDMIAIGRFHPRMLPHYASDYAWTYKAHRKGFRIRMCPELVYRYDADATGDNFYDTLTRKKLFSKRSAANPVYRINYIFLATPPKYILSEFFHQLGRYAKKKDVIKDVLQRR